MAAQLRATNGLSRLAREHLLGLLNLTINSNQASAFLSIKISDPSQTLEVSFLSAPVSSNIAERSDLTDPRLYWRLMNACVHFE